MTQPTCQTCRYWKLWNGSSEGRCHHRSPVVHPHNYGGSGSTEMKTYWPRADRDEFCGDHSFNQAELDNIKNRVFQYFQCNKCMHIWTDMTSCPICVNKETK